jgi:hypothetical protein
MIKKVLPTAQQQQAARLSYMAFRNREGAFGSADALADASVCPPEQWWQMYGIEHPELTRVAVRVLSQVREGPGYALGSLV